MEKILIVNVGSDSIKFKIYLKNEKIEIANGVCEKIFTNGNFKINYLVIKNEKIKKKKMKSIEVSEKFGNYELAIQYLLNKFLELKILNDLDEIKVVGHRIVHGGYYFSESVIVDENVENKINALTSFAPIHNKFQLEVLRIIKNKINNSINIASFDTTFHKSIPKINYTYGLPKDWIKNLKIRKYGAHGISYSYITKKAKEILKKDEVNLIVCHLGSGSSICAIKKNNSINTSMGFSPNSGLIMGKRSGDIDSSIINYVLSKYNHLSISNINDILNNESGMFALTNESDFFEIIKNIDKNNDFEFAIDLYCKRAAEYIVNYINELEKNIDAIIFTGGIGEKSSEIRKKIIENIKIIKLKISNSNNKNFDDYLKISSSFSTKIFVVKTDEELQIFNDILNLI